MAGGVEMAVGSQSDYAKHANISRQAVSKLVKQGKIPRRPDGKIDFAEADHARQQNSDPGRLENQGKVSGVSNQSSVSSNGLNFSDARTATEAYNAKLKQLEYERQVGQLVPIRDVENAMVTAGRRIRQSLDQIVLWADELEAAARNGGPDAVRAKLKERVRGLESGVADALSLMADDEV